jgi:hypothetical protein
MESTKMSEDANYNSLLLKAKRFVDYFQISAKELQLNPYILEETQGYLDKLIPLSSFIKDTNILTPELLEDSEKYEKQKQELTLKDWRDRQCFNYAISIIEYYKNNYYTPAWKAEDLANFILREHSGDKKLNFPYGVLNEVKSVKIEIVERFRSEALNGDPNAQLIMALLSPFESAEHRLWLEVAIRFGNRPALILLSSWMYAYGFFAEAFILYEILGNFDGATFEEVCENARVSAIEYSDDGRGYPYISYYADSLLILYLNSIEQNRFSESLPKLLSRRGEFSTVADFISNYISEKEVNLNKANKVYLNLANSGDVDAQFSLAKTYMQYDPAAAYQWLRMAADGGLYDAQFLLGWWLSSRVTSYYYADPGLHYDKLFQSKFKNKEERSIESNKLIQSAAWNGQVLALWCTDFIRYNSFSSYDNLQGKLPEENYYQPDEDCYAPIQFYSHCLLTCLTPDRFTKDLMINYLRESSEHIYNSGLNRLCWINHGKFRS